MFQKKQLLQLLLVLLLIVYCLVNVYVPDPYRFENLFYLVAAVLVGAIFLIKARK